MDNKSTSQQYIDHLREVEARFQRTYSQWNSDSDLSPTSDGDPSQNITKEGADGESVLRKTAVEDLLNQISGGYLTLKDGRKLFLTEPSAQTPGEIKRIRRPRTIYTSQQVNALNHIFCRTQYLSMSERTAVAGKLGLSQTQVKVWFQNKRSNLKKHLAKGARRGAGTHQFSEKRDFDPMLFPQASGDPGVIAFSGGNSMFPERSLSADGVSTLTSPAESHPSEIFAEFFEPPGSLSAQETQSWSDRFAAGSAVTDWLSQSQQPSWSDSSGEFYAGSDSSAECSVTPTMTNMEIGPARAGSAKQPLQQEAKQAADHQASATAGMGVAMVTKPDGLPGINEWIKTSLHTAEQQT